MNMYKKSWSVEAYKFNGGVYCRDCVADTLNDDSFRDEYPNSEHDDFHPIFSDALDNYVEDGLECDYCFVVIYEGE